ncbi:MAG: RimK/LysX family protein [Spirochaetales bacterium]|nr:RimK/LysX family protein [Spirochaetales bacterium]
MDNILNDISTLTPLGWKEWVSFPDWEIDYIKAKVDTGAQTSTLHAEEMTIFNIDKKIMVKFKIYPWQNNKENGKEVTTEVITFRKIRSSSGCLEKRPVIKTTISVADKTFETELTLTNRQLMGFRMLIGRRTLDKKFVITTAKSCLGKKAPKNIIKSNNRSSCK